MTNTTLLRKKINESGYKLRFIAQKVGISYQGLSNKINNQREFKANEIQILYDLLKLTEEERVKIFFAINVDDLSTNQVKTSSETEDKTA